MARDVFDLLGTEEAQRLMSEAVQRAADEARRLGLPEAIEVNGEWMVMQSNHDGRCGTPQVMRGQLTLRPEVEAVEPVLEAQGYAAVPSGRHDGRWELWTRESNITSGPSETFASRGDALAAGRTWRDTR